MDDKKKLNDDSLRVESPAANEDTTLRVGYRAANEDDAHSAGRPPAEPDVRRDRLGRPIHPNTLKALRSGQYRPGESGNPAGRFRGRGLQEAIRSQMRKNQLRSTDPIESLLTALDAG
jgi:hypothetical protein